DDVAIVRERDVAAAEAHEHRLRVVDRRRARRTVARMAECERAGELVEGVGRARRRPRRRRRCPPTPARDAAANRAPGARAPRRPGLRALRIFHTWITMPMVEGVAPTRLSRQSPGT